MSSDGAGHPAPVPDRMGGPVPSAVPSAPAVLVVVPARDEADRVQRCLRSVRLSLAAASASGSVGPVAVVVVAHRCSDDTAARAELALHGLTNVVLADRVSTVVGQVRAFGVAAGLRLLGVGSVDGAADPASTWVLSTDADSVVPPGWVESIMVHARAGRHAVVGMTELLDPGWADQAVQAAYGSIIASKLRGAAHDHVYGANLAVRADAYAAVGGFPAVPVGEDQAIVDALQAQGFDVARPRSSVVWTSGRRVGRATGGLADLLASLERETSAGDQASMTTGMTIGVLR